MSLREKLAAKKAAMSKKTSVAAPAEKKTSKKVTVEKKVEKNVNKSSGRGRPKGVKYTVTKEYYKTLEELFDTVKGHYDSLEDNLSKFLEKGNKSAARDARKNVQDISRVAKILRKTIQDAKGNLKQEAA